MVTNLILQTKNKLIYGNKRKRDFVTKFAFSGNLLKRSNPDDKYINGLDLIIH